MQKWSTKYKNRKTTTSALKTTIFVRLPRRVIIQSLFHQYERATDGLAKYGERWWSSWCSVLLDVFFCRKSKALESNRPRANEFQHLWVDRRFLPFRFLQCFGFYFLIITCDTKTYYYLLFIYLLFISVCKLTSAVCQLRNDYTFGFRHNSHLWFLGFHSFSLFFFISLQFKCRDNVMVGPLEWGDNECFCSRHMITERNWILCDFELCQARGIGQNAHWIEWELIK